MGDQERWMEAKAIFGEALEVPEAGRAEFLAARCGADSALRAEVEKYLRILNVAGNFLDNPTPGTGERGSRDLESHAEARELLGSSIGPYRILDLLGEGGFGTVYLAEQEKPIARRVALKILKLGMDTKEVIARFDSERQALALMNHPHIAKVYDAGATERGRPYFVMEHVPGEPITGYCDRHRLGTTQRLKLFMRVCEGVQHAHQKGVIHRDIKPTNVLVALEDGEPVPKIIDFGVAKAMNQRLTKERLFTGLGQMVGTPEYMSPEQAEMGALDLDSRSDLYSLGVLLYELLTGVLPFDPEDLRSAGLAGIQRIIREKDPMAPSTRLGSLGDAARDSARTRATEARTLIREIRGDLDWITMKAMEKDRGRRYSSASELAADIQRHLQGEAVLASPPSVVYRLMKVARRHRGKVAAAGLVLAALIAGLAASTILYLDARGARDLAEQRAQDAERARASAGENARLAAARLEEIQRLSDVQRLEEAAKEVEELWPAFPEKAPAMEEWLTKARFLAGRLELHREALAKLRGSALGTAGAGVAGSEDKAEKTQGGGPWRFADVETQWRHDTLAALIDGLGGMLDPKQGLVAGVEARLEFARTIRKRSIEDHAEAWKRAVECIANEKECPQYRGLRIEPQIGLVPLGQDPDSRLWEFALLQTGTAPERGGDGKLIRSDDMALVLVLLPGGPFLMGAERARLGASLAKTERGLAVAGLEQGSLAESMGIETGDFLLSIGGRDVASFDAIDLAMQESASGDTIRVTVLRQGEKRDFSGTLGRNRDPYAEGKDGPVHEVTLAPFFISKFEMTQGQWLRVTGENPSAQRPGMRWGDKTHTLLHPVEQVDWPTSRRVLERLGLRLPSEAEWEYSARAGTAAIWWTGKEKESLAGAANIADRFADKYGDHAADWKYESWLDDGYALHAPVGAYRPNAFGLHDMVGNVWEWCEDAYASYAPAKSEPAVKDQDTEKLRRAARGGSWYQIADFGRSARRMHGEPGVRSDIQGVRPGKSIVGGAR